MDKIVPALPKGHVSCLSDAFRYTRASETDIGRTFARVRESLLREEQRGVGPRLVQPQRKLGSGRTS